jgi:hypothetical protein
MRSARLGEFLVDFWSFDVGQQFAFLYLAADVLWCGRRLEIQ